MVVDIPVANDDDRVFMANLNGLVARLAAEDEPEVVYAIRVNKWFDHKWLRFSGKGRVAFDYGYGDRDTALDSKWQENLTFPPFNPKQVTDQVSWSHSAEGYRKTEVENPLHKPERRHSASNLQNRVSRFTKSGLFVWFSGSTKSNERASVMVYRISDSTETAWYASLGGEHGWKVDRVKGIDRDTVQGWFPLG